MYDKIRKPLVIVNLILSAVLMLAVLVGGALVLAGIGNAVSSLGDGKMSTPAPTQRPVVAPTGSTAADWANDQRCVDGHDIVTGDPC